MMLELKSWTSILRRWKGCLLPGIQRRRSSCMIRSKHGCLSFLSIALGRFKKREIRRHQVSKTTRRQVQPPWLTVMEFPFRPESRSPKRRMIASVLPCHQIASLRANQHLLRNESKRHLHLGGIRRGASSKPLRLWLPVSRRRRQILPLTRLYCQRSWIRRLAWSA